MAVEAIKAKVNREEWRWVSIWSPVILLVTSLPHICMRCTHFHATVSIWWICHWGKGLNAGDD
jgi:hypothetical protein